MFGDLYRHTVCKRSYSLQYWKGAYFWIYILKGHNPLKICHFLVSGNVKVVNSENVHLYTRYHYLSSDDGEVWHVNWVTRTFPIPKMVCVSETIFVQCVDKDHQTLFIFFIQELLFTVFMYSLLQQFFWPMIMYAISLKLLDPWLHIAKLQRQMNLQKHIRNTKCKAMIWLCVIQGQWSGNEILIFLRINTS